MSGFDPALAARIEAIRRGTPAPSAGPQTAPRTPATRPLPGSKPLAHAGPFAALAPILQGAREIPAAGKNTLGTVLDLLSRPGRAFEHFYASPDAFHPDLAGAAHVFAHGNSQAEMDTDRASIRHQLGLDRAYAGAPHAVQGIGDFLIDTVTDPTTFVGGSGALEGVGRKIAPKVLPGVLRAGASIGKAARGFESSAQASAKALAPRLPQFARAPVQHVATHGMGVPEALDQMGELIGALYDTAGPHNELGRRAVLRYGQPGRDMAQEAVMARNASRAMRSQLHDQLVGDFHSAIKTLTPQEEDTVYRALHTGTEAKLPPKLQGPAQRISQLTDTIAWLQGTKGLRNELTRNGFKLGDEYAPFESATPRRIQTQAQYRKNYVPTAHDSGWIDAEEQHLGGLLAKQQAKRRAHFASEYDPNLLPRGDEPAARNLLDPEFQRQLFANRFAAASRSIAGRDTRLRAAAAFGTQAKHLPAFVEKYLEPIFTAPEDKSAMLRLLDKFWRPAVDIPKQALFALPFRHMINIGTLAALHDPGSLAEAVNLFAKQFTKGGIKSEAERRALMHDAYNAGVLSVGAMDRARPWTQRLPLVGNLYGASSGALWAFDDAVKTAVYRRAIRRGLSPQVASRETLNALIDYSNRSDFTNALSYVAPFATYRSKLPGAIARATLKHPERELAIGRAAPALAGGQQPAPYADQQGTPMVSRGYTPLSDILSGVDDPWGFARTSMAWPAQLAASVLNWNPPGREAHYFTYGYPRDAADRSAPWTPGAVAKYAANQMPYAQNVLEGQGLGVFPNRGVVRPMVEGQTGVRLTYPRRDSSQRNTRTDPAAMRLRSIEATYRHPISLLKKAGDDQGAQILDDLMQATLAGDRDKVRTLQAQFQQHRLERVRAMLSNGTP